MNEIWKEIPEYSGVYSVSNTGKVRSNKTMKTKGTYNNPLGYEFVLLFKDGKSKKHRVHRLVAFAFIDNPENKPFINHLNSNPRDNHVSNLAWCTQKENIQYAYDHGNKVPNYATLGYKRDNGCKYHNIYLDKTRNRWVANVDYTDESGAHKKRKFFALSRFKSSEECQLHAAHAVNEILSEIGDTSRPRNPVTKLESGEIVDVSTSPKAD